MKWLANTVHRRGMTALAGDRASHWCRSTTAGGYGAAVVSRVLYFDCFSRISGDTALGALLDAGLPLGELTRALGSLAASGLRRCHGDLSQCEK